MPEDVSGYPVSYHSWGTLALFLLLGNIFSIFPIHGLAHCQHQHNFCARRAGIFSPSIFMASVKKGLWGYIKDTASPIFVFPLEVISQLSRTLSLTIRLFGNILSTDLVVAIIFSLIPFIVPLPLAALGMLTGVLQAYIFTVLASLYIASAIEIADVEEERRQMKQELKKS